MSRSVKLCEFLFKLRIHHLQVAKCSCLGMTAIVRDFSRAPPLKAATVLLNRARQVRAWARPAGGHWSAQDASSRETWLLLLALPGLRYGLAEFHESSSLRAVELSNRPGEDEDCIRKQGGAPGPPRLFCTPFSGHGAVVVTSRTARVQGCPGHVDSSRS